LPDLTLPFQFDAIEKLSYDPTFDHVRDVVIQTLDSAAQYVEETEKKAQP
jgi:hypothetical protein